MPKVTRKQEREKQKKNFLDGRARGSHTHSSSLRRSLDEATSSSADVSPGVCPQCYPVLSRYTTTFKEMVHSGTELKKRKKVNPSPRRSESDLTHYRDITGQNEWIRANLFDSIGNYLYCYNCIRASLGVSKDRLSRQRSIKRQQSHEPIVEMTKSEVEEQRLGQFVVMPAVLELSFKKWWSTVQPSDTLNVRYPHQKHGNALKTSHSAKTKVMDKFLEFVDINTQPNGRSADSSGPTHYFLPKFTTIQGPKLGVSHYAERLARSVVGEFNRAQQESGGSACSNGSSHNWLKANRPKVAICPHQEDYCDTCSRRKAEIHAKQTTINRLLQSSMADPDDVKTLEDEMAATKQTLETHRQEAQVSHKYFIDMTARCYDEWKKISDLQGKPILSEEERVELNGLKNSFNLVLSADYQMQKLVPYWGLSPQPGSTYYLQKLNHDIFGIVNHAQKSSSVYLFDERVGPKNTDHTISYLWDYISKLPTWLRRVHLFLDNTSSTNKNCYLMAWAYEMIQQGRLSFLRVSFLIAGHTKFSPDLLFSRIAQTYNKSDVFSTQELKDVIALYADVTIDDGAIVCDWRNAMAKYSKLPGIRSLHDFIFVKNPVTDTVLAKVRKNCAEGNFENATIHVINGRDIEECVIPNQANDNYSSLGKLRPLSESKRKHLGQMSKDFIPADRHLPFINIII